MTSVKKKKGLMGMQPLGKPRKTLNTLQKEFMKKHKEEHSPKHLAEMRKLLLKGYCIEQSHKIATKFVGK